MTEHPDPDSVEVRALKPEEVEMTIPELLAFAIRLHRDERLDEAEKCYRSLLQFEPGNANALHFLGVLEHQRGNDAIALELVRKSIDLDPSVASWHNNLGNVLLRHDQFDDAVRAYARCVELDPGNLAACNNLGLLLRKLDRPVESEEMLKHVVAADPKFGDAHTNLARLYTSLGRMPEAFSHFADALALKPADNRIRRLMAVAYASAGRMADGLKTCREWVALAPDDAMAQHFLAAFGGAEVPQRASDAYVEQEFDGFARTFDAQLAALGYRAPQWVLEAVAHVAGEPRRQWNILDVGCGTGLCGPLLRPYASAMAGVDLSAKMLDLARPRAVYDRLVKAELVAFLEQRDDVYDLVVSADTLCYFGRLDEAFAGVISVLRTGGYWVFTVEAHPEAQAFKLQAHGRYSHSRDYIESALLSAGFRQITLREVELRFESGKPVAGWLICARADGT